MTNPARRIGRNGVALQRGDPSLLRAVALEWIKHFNEDKVAKKFDIDARTVARILARDDIQQYVARRMLPMEKLAEAGARRLLEEALKSALDPSLDWKERTENRKLLARTLLPEIKSITVKHNHYIRAPARAQSIEDWHKQLPESARIVEAEVIDE